MSTVELDLMELLAEAEAQGTVKEVKLGKVKKPAKSQTTKLLEAKPTIDDPVIVPVPVAIVNFYLVVKCSCGSEHKFLTSSRVKLRHAVKTGRREEFIKVQDWTEYKELDSLPEEESLQSFSVISCNNCNTNCL